MPEPRSLVGSVVERNSTLKPSKSFVSQPEGSTNSGFPSVQHRSKSAFVRAREAQKNKAQAIERPKDVPVVKAVAGPSSGRVGGRSGNRVLRTDEVAGDDTSQDWRDSVSRESERRVEAMTDEEREQERAEILEKFGSNVGDILRKAKEARERDKKREREGVEHAPHATSSSDLPRHGGILTPPGSRPTTPARLNRKIRFADVTPDDVHVYESQPSSPRRTMGLLAPPTSEDKDVPVIKLPSRLSSRGSDEREISNAELSSNTQASKSLIDSTDDPIAVISDEGTPEDIRRRFFPNVPARDPSLEWIEQDASIVEHNGPSRVRFDLSGRVIPPEQYSTLPTHLGLHHHSSSAAGYTLDDLFLLSRSTVPAQRSTMIGVLSKIIRGLGRGRFPELRGLEMELRKRALATGLEAIDERGSLGIQAIELTWECIVVWDEELGAIDGVELKTPKSDSSNLTTSSNAISSSDIVEGQRTPPTTDPIESVPLDFFLPQIATHFIRAALPHESLSQLLSILDRLARHSSDIASTIVKTPNLLRSIMSIFILTPIPPRESSPPPDPFAVRLLRTLAIASRENAQALVEPADALLRFITTIPTQSPYPLQLATDLLTSTFELYATLAKYGFYAHVATAASSYFATLGSYIYSKECTSRSLMKAWLRLLETLMICARDPHQTNPPHDILWSQIVGWGWGEDVLTLRHKLSANSEDRDVWSALWRACAAWLEGCRVNSVKNGTSERLVVVESVKDGFEKGVEKAVIAAVTTGLQEALTADSKTWIAAIPGTPGWNQYKQNANLAECLQSYWQFSLACSSTVSASTGTPIWIGGSLQTLSTLANIILDHPMWTGGFITNCAIRCLYLRPFTTFLVYHLRILRAMSVEEEKWLSLAVAVLQRLLPGDEEPGRWILNEVIKGITSSHERPDTEEQKYTKDNIALLVPFLEYSLRPKNGMCIAPWVSSPLSISLATTQAIPANCNTIQNGNFGVPFAKDWSVGALNYLLHSGSSEVFQNLPSSWDASETDIVRASLLLARITQEMLVKSNQSMFAMSREQVVFACMQVFMLEHGQKHNDSNEEVFRDNLVGQLMESLLQPLTFSASPGSPRLTSESIEDSAKGFLGPSTPFYQFYTDFVGLYDAISFSHPLFARLLLPPTSMRYPLDYRKYLWGDYGHVLRTLRIPIEQVLIDDLNAYMWPIERDPEMLGWYLRALVKWPLEGFVRLVAIHHVACNIWPDLREGDERQERAKMLLRPIVDQGTSELVRDIVRYRQEPGGHIMLPPVCFPGDGPWKGIRLKCLATWGGVALTQKLEKIFLTP